MTKCNMFAFSWVLGHVGTGLSGKRHFCNAAGHQARVCPKERGWGKGANTPQMSSTARYATTERSAEHMEAVPCAKVGKHMSDPTICRQDLQFRHRSNKAQSEQMMISKIGPPCEASLMSHLLSVKILFYSNRLQSGFLSFTSHASRLCIISSVFFLCGCPEVVRARCRIGSGVHGKKFPGSCVAQCTSLQACKQPGGHPSPELKSAVICLFSGGRVSGKTRMHQAMQTGTRPWFNTLLRARIAEAVLKC